MASYTREGLEVQTVAALRKLACDDGLGSGTWRAGASKVMLIEALMSGEVAERMVPEENVRDVFTEAVGSLVENAAKRYITPEHVERIIKRCLSEHTRTLTVQRLDGTSAELGRTHPQLDTLIQMLTPNHSGKRLNVMMVGPAGSGKTTAARQAAEALGLQFYPFSFSSQTTEARLLGYIDAQSRPVRTSFREAFENGGLWLADELDTANPQVMPVLNSALDNGVCSFPDAIVKRHRDFVCVAGANTFCTGADRVYVARQAQDGTLNERFAVLEWSYDEALERHLADDDTWVDYVQKARKAVNTLSIRHIVSPRASMHGAHLLRCGLPAHVVETATIWKHMDKTTREKVAASMGVACYAPPQAEEVAR